MKNLKNKKGITLVALVVTIIVLLILAGVSLSLVAGGNGIITRASDSSTQSLDSAAKEQAELAISEAITAYYTARYVNGTASSVSAIPEYVGEYFGTSNEKTLSDGTLKVTNTTTGAVELTVTKTGHKFTSTINPASGSLDDWTQTT